jgi:serine/threonine-protein kinase
VSEEAALTVQPGEILVEKYRVERVLGQGGMGVVVLAEHIELRERVAIKFLLTTEGDTTELSERFLREARAAVRIKSEHVVRVVDVGRLPTGAPYMVMEYLEGEDLAQRLLSGPVPIEDAVDYVIQGCEAMQAAHRLGIVHRDLKPANLFLTQRPDGSSLIKVLDFGISKVKTTDIVQLSLTHTQAMMGSPLYMSPEQMRSSKDVSSSADIWSLGVILHELIAGDVPFTGSTFPEVLVQVMSEPPLPLRSLRADVPEGLEAVVLRCLEKKPADRYSSVAALAVALTPYASTRTFGLQARLRSSMSHPPIDPLPAPVILLLEAPMATAPTARAPLPAPGELLPVFAASVEQSPTKTNIAWGEHSRSGTSRTVLSRRRWLVSAGVAIALVGIVALSLRRGPRGADPSASPPAVSVAAEGPGVTPAPAPVPAEAAPRPREPLVRPAPPEPDASWDATPDEPVAPSNTGKTEPSVAPVSALDEHTPAAPPTATTADPANAPVAPHGAAKPRATGKPSEKPARARAPAAPPTQPRASAHAPRPASGASKTTRSKPLSIEFK